MVICMKRGIRDKLIQNTYNNSYIHSHNGQYVTYGAMARAPLAIPASMLIFKNFSFHGFWMTRWTDTHTNEERYEMLKDLVELMDKGQLREPRWTEVPWTEEGMKQAADGGIQGFTQGKQICFPTKA